MKERNAERHLAVERTKECCVLKKISQKKHPHLRKVSTQMLTLASTFIILFVAANSCEKLRRLRINDPPDCKTQIGKIEFTHLWKDDLSCLGGQGFPQQNLVIKTSAEWNAFLNSLDSVDSDLAQWISKTSTDFSTNKILALFDETRYGEFWGIEIADITEYACHIVVSYHTWKKISFNWNAYTQYCHIVRIPAANKPIVFQEEYDEFGNEPANVPYFYCTPYTSGDTFFFRGTAYLFIDSMPAGQTKKDGIMNIIYYTDRDTAYFSARYPYGGGKFY